MDHTLHQAWRGECGGKDAASAYCLYVTEGLAGAAENPLNSDLGEWVIGSRDFLNRMVALAAGGDQADPGRADASHGGDVGGRGYPSGRSTPEGGARGRRRISVHGRWSRNGDIVVPTLHERHPCPAFRLFWFARSRQLGQTWCDEPNDAQWNSASYRRQIALAESQSTTKTENQV